MRKLYKQEVQIKQGFAGAMCRFMFPILMVGVAAIIGLLFYAIFTESDTELRLLIGTVVVANLLPANWIQSGIEPVASKERARKEQ